MLEWLLTFILFLCAILLILSIHMARNNNYWKEKGFPYLKPWPVFGNFFEVFLWRKSIGEQLRNVYQTSRQPLLGMFILDRPVLLINDIDLIERILVTDFEYFRNRGMETNEPFDPIGSKTIFFTNGPLWKTERSKALPAFTTGKLRIQVESIKSSAKKMTQSIHNTMQSKEVSLDLKSLFSKYTVENTTTSFFGLKSTSFEDEDSVFTAIAKRLMNCQHVWPTLQISYLLIAPQFKRLLRLKFIDEISENFFRKLTWDSLIQREESNSRNNDLIDILLNVKKKNNIVDQNSVEADYLVAQVVTAFIGGFETTSTTLTFALYELARCQEVQELARQEIMKIKNKYGDFTYDNLKEMKYLERCIMESMRMYPLLPFMDRACSKEYKIPGTDLIVEKGIQIYLPVMGIHFNPKYYPNPQKFDPDRFTTEKVQERPKCTYLPFGSGPRTCPGNRFALFTMKIGLANILLNFEVKFTKETPESMTFSRIGFMLQPDKEVYLKFTKL